VKLTETTSKETKSKINSDEFKDLARKKVTHFTRSRKMPFEDVMMFYDYVA